MTTALTCPVCAYVVPATPSCTRCDWVLSAGPWLDVDPLRRRNDFHAELTAARQEFDVAAALLASGDDADLLGRLLAHVRGGAPEQPVRVRPAAHRTEPLAAVGATAMELVARRGELAVVDVRLDGVAVARIDVTDRHVPALTGTVRLHAWRDLMPSLPHDPDELALVLAGGVGRDQRRAPVELADLDLGDHVLVLHRLAGLTIPDIFVSRFADVRLVSRGEPLDDAAVASWIARAPLRHDISLVLVDVDDAGVTRPVTRTLFSAGTSARDLPLARVNVQAPAGGRDALALAVVSGPPGTPPRQCAPISVLRCDLTPSQPHELEFRLDGPGEVALVRPGGTTDATTAAGWPDLLDEMPMRYQPDANALDLAIALELGGDPDTVNPRRDLAVGVLAHLAAHHPDPSAVRVCVIGYDDHLRGRGVLKKTRGFVGLQDAEDFAATLPCSTPVEPKGAPVEDALATARALTWRPLPSARRLLVIGGRPPHPAVDAGISRCPHQYDWRVLLRQLENDHVVHAAVWDRPAWTERSNNEAKLATQTWHALASPRPPMLLHGGVTAAYVVKEAKAVRDATPQPPLLFPLVIKN
ncbi:hypothetical protein [Lentzea sp. NBRC 102530]|uniref:hypothetical protein n=1 Tax=Lentzea sp. NBRC 102530 TaxID=3032201 RepID=UPI0024A572DD|nr:hypothetical protein [Lentzea sp. NBRC 102530]GLY50783.1 hypothetical protein Lesp01_44390 [Lentzea sp. NBRC 102530]